MIPSSWQSKYETRNDGINKGGKAIQKVHQTKPKGCKNYNIVSKENSEVKSSKNRQLRNVLSEKIVRYW